MPDRNMFKHHDKHSLGVSRYLQGFQLPSLSTFQNPCVSRHLPSTSSRFRRCPWDFRRTGRVHMKQDYMGRPSGEVFVEFISTEEARAVIVCSQQENPAILGVTNRKIMEKNMETPWNTLLFWVGTHLFPCRFSQNQSSELWDQSKNCFRYASSMLVHWFQELNGHVFLLTRN